ncbi:hypothetical protein EVAR_91988_1 [Eumeta japonica]|uniref:DUF5641 domain-containing protein n=1 Tax=Eumeta variegata TaxID=151549 RepID=A0A4C2AEM8_EUMVA|nr:hypothetical protein EVAR_91988_1 [Eumeta japonica]
MHHGGVETVVNELRQRIWVLRLRPSVRARLAHHQTVHLHGPGLLRPVLGHRGPPTLQTIRGPIHVFDHASRSSRARGVPLRGRSDTHSQALHGAPRVSDGDLERQGHQLRGGGQRAAKRGATGVRRGSIRAPGPLAIHTAGRTIHGGGAWERMVQSVKRALTTVLQEQHPREEVLSTLLAEAEFTVNSRPLTHVSVSAEDPEALTPNHFLLGGAARVPTPGAFVEADLNSRQQWRRAQRLADHFWQRWLREYLPLLQRRHSSQQKGTPPEVDDMVLIVDENLPRNTWPRGRVLELYPGKDGVVRVVELQTAAGRLKRPVKKIVVLPK